MGIYVQGMAFKPRSAIVEPLKVYQALGFRRGGGMGLGDSGVE